MTKTMRKNQRGFTFIEMVMALVIIAVITLLAGPLLAVSLDAITLHMDRLDLEQSASTVMARMSREIRRLRNDESVLIAASNVYAFYDVDGVLLGYFQAGNNLMRFQLPPGAASYPLAENLQPASLAFIYYDDQGAVLPAPVTGLGASTDIRSIELRLTFQDGAGANTMPITTTIRPRNLKHVSELFS